MAVVYSIKEIESYLQAILVWQLNHNLLSEVQRECGHSCVTLIAPAGLSQRSCQVLLAAILSSRARQHETQASSMVLGLPEKIYVSQT